MGRLRSVLGGRIPRVWDQQTSWVGTPCPFQLETHDRPWAVGTYGGWLGARHVGCAGVTLQSPPHRRRRYRGVGVRGKILRFFFSNH